MTKIRKSIFPLCLVLCLTLLTACNSANSPRHNSAVDQRLRTILHRLDRDGQPVVAARVIDLNTGRELYSENADQQMIPASNMKLLITAAALDFFGPDHVFETYLVEHNGNLWIIGTGDPGIGDQPIAARRGGDTMTVLEDWAAAVSSYVHNDRRIKTLYYYDGAFDDEQIHPTWGRGDLVNWYAAPVSGLNFNDNCIDVTVYPTEEGKPVRYEVVPPVRDIKIINNCTTGEKNDASIERAQDQNVFTISGSASKRTVLRSKPVTNPGAFFADALRTELEKRDIQIGSIERAERPPYGFNDPRAYESIQVLAVHETKLRELLPRINKNSQNLLAEALCKLLGRAYDYQRWRPGPGSWASGSDAVHAFLEKSGIDHSGIVVADGSGLSRDNRVTTRTISDLLVFMHSHKHAKVFFDSLSVGGVDGTIRNRYTDKPGHVHAKTGFIGGVRSLSGYVPSRRGTIVFSFIYNRVPGSVRPYEELQDYAVRTLMSWPNLDYTPPPATQPGTEPATQPATQPATAPAAGN